MSKIYEGDEVHISLDCKTSVDAQDDLWIYHKKPESEITGLWKATGVGNFAEYDTIQYVDLDESGRWELQPYSDTLDVHGDIIIMPVFPPLIPARKGFIRGYLVGI